MRKTWPKWLRRAVKIVLGFAAVVLVLAVSGIGFLWYKAHAALSPSGYQPDKPLLSYADEPAPPLSVRFSPPAFSWDTIADPPRTSMPWVRWWWPGNDVNPDELARELEELHDANFGGAEVQAFSSGVDPVIGKDSALHNRVYAVDTPQYLASVRSALASAQRLGLQVDLSDYSGWPGGSPAVAAKDGVQNIIWSQASFRGGKHIEIDIPRPSPHVNALVLGLINYITSETLGEFDPSAATLISVLVAHPLGGTSSALSAFGYREPLQLDPKSIQVVDAQVSNGKLDWDAPDGNWVLIASWVMPTGEQPNVNAFPGHGYAVNALDAERVRANYNYAFGARTGYAPYYGGTLRGIFNDSLEYTIDRSASADILSEFQKRRGYDLRPFLPAIYIDASDNLYFGHQVQFHPRFRISNADERVRYDYQLTLSELMIERFFATSHQWTNERGLVSRAQPYGYDLDVIHADGLTDIPETEQLESLGSSTFLRLASSGGMLYGRTLISAECLGFPGAEYTTNAAKMKASADLLFVNGVSQLIYHGFPYNWKPTGHDGQLGPQGWEPFVTNSALGGNVAENYSPSVPLWTDMKSVNLYIARAQNLLRQGQQTADVLIYYPKFNAANPTIPPNPKEPLADGHFPLTDPTTGFQSLPMAGMEPAPLIQWLNKVKPVIDALDRRGITWQWVNGDGLRNQLTTEGKTLFGSPFGAILFAEDDAAMPEDLAAAEKLAAAGKPVFFVGPTPSRQLGYLNADAGDASVRASVERLTKLRPVIPNSDDLANTIIAAVHPSLIFDQPSDLRRETRVVGQGTIDFFANMYDQSRQAVLRVSGLNGAWWFDAQTGTAAPISQTVNGTITLTLRPYESRFLIRGIRMPAILKTDNPASLLTVSLTGQTWPLPTWDLMVGSVERHSGLFDWRNDPDLRYDGDVAVYTTTLEGFQQKTGDRYLLRVGLVPGTASVRINGHDAGIASIPPGDVDITPFIHDGSNSIEITYRQSPRNVQIGLALKGDKSVRYLKKRNKAMVPAGLIGPISIVEAAPIHG